MFVLLVFIAAGLSYLYLKHVNGYWKRRNVPGPEPTLLFGNISDVFWKKKSMGEIFYDIYRKYEDYPYVGVFRTVTPCLIARDPDLIRDVTVKHFKCFEDNDVVVSSHANPVIGRNPFVLKGSEWKTARTRLTSSFTSGKMKTLFPLVNENGKKMVKYFEKQLEGHKEFVCRTEFEKFTLENVASCSVGLEAKAFEDEYTGFKYIANNFMIGSLAMLKSAFIFILPGLFQRFRIRVFNYDVEERTKGIVQEVAKYRAQNRIERPDFLHQLQQVGAKDASFTINDVAVGIAAIIMDGYDTSANVFSYLAYEVARHQDIQNRLREEIEETLNANDNELTYDTMQEMKLLEASILECLRLHPIFMSLAKTCVQPYTYETSETSVFKKMSVTIEPGTIVAIPYDGLHRDPRFFIQPEEYRPDRFLNDEKNDLPKYVFMPFGEGPRSCLGQRFGVLQLKVGLVYLIRNFRVKLCPESDVPLKVEPWHFVRTPVGTIKITLEKV